MNALKIAASLIFCVVLAAHSSAYAGVVAEETTVIDFLQMFTMDARVITSIEGNKARLDSIVRMREGQSGVDDQGMRSTEIHRLDRGVVYSLIEPARQYQERKLGSPAPALDSSRQFAQIASGLQCQWTTAEVAKTDVGREVVDGETTAHVRIDASRRCVPTAPDGSSCTLRVTYDQWSTKPNKLHAQLARYRRDYAAQAGPGTGIAEEFMFFSQFGVPVDPMLLELIRRAVASDGQALKTTAVLRVSRSCFTQAEGVSDATSTQPAQSDPAFLLQYMGAMLLWAWVAEKDPQSADGSADPSTDGAETLGTIATELKTIRTQKLPESEFELPAGFTRAF
jgi:hypothetical protein